MRMAWHILVSTAVLVSFGAPALADADPARIATLTRSLLSDDSNERITAVVELEKLGADAAPALPVMKAAMAREDDAGIKVLMMKAIASIEAAPRDAIQPTDITGHAERVHALIQQLASPAERKDAHAALDKLGVVARSVTLAHADRPELTLDDCRVIITKTMWDIAGQLAAEDAKLRIRAIRDLAEFGAAAQPTLRTLGRLSVNDPDPNVRKLAGRAVAKIEKEVATTQNLRAADTDR